VKYPFGKLLAPWQFYIVNSGKQNERPFALKKLYLFNRLLRSKAGKVWEGFPKKPPYYSLKTTRKLL